MSEKLLIVGAGGHGRCCLDIAREQGIYSEISFLDDTCVEKIVNETHVIGDTGHLEMYANEYRDVFVAIGNNLVRKQLAERIEKCGGRVVSLISKKSFISPFATVGRGCVIFPGAVVEANAKIGEGTIIAANTVINHDAVIEEYSLINSGSVIRPNTKIGKLSKVGCGCVVSFGKVLDVESDVLDGEII